MKNKYTVQRPNMDVINVMRIMLATETRKDIRILELGCNEGINLHTLHDIYPDAEYYGMDYCDEATEAGVKKYSEITFMCMDIENLHVEFLKPYDYILMPDILEHLSDPLQCLRKVKAALNPGGVTVSCIPNLMHVSVMQDLLQYGYFNYRDVGLLDSDHKHLFTRNNIVDIFDAAGFKIEEILRSNINLSGSQREFLEMLHCFSSGNQYISQEDFETFEYIVVTEPKEEEE